MSIIKAGLNLNDITPYLSEKGWINIDLMVQDKTDQFGNNVDIYVSQTLAQREAKETKKRLGSAKVVYTKDGLISVATKIV
jgi:galactitol-specific phosphotransferase system IIB component